MVIHTCMYKLIKTAQIKDVEHIIKTFLPDAMARKQSSLSLHEPCLVLHRQTWDSHRMATHSRMIYQVPVTALVPS